MNGVRHDSAPPKSATEESPLFTKAIDVRSEWNADEQVIEVLTVAMAAALSSGLRWASHSWATHEERFPAVVFGDVSIGTRVASAAKSDIDFSRDIVAPREDPILTHPTDV